MAPPDQGWAALSLLTHHVSSLSIQALFLCSALGAPASTQVICLWFCDQEEALGLQSHSSRWGHKEICRLVEATEKVLGLEIQFLDLMRLEEPSPVVPEPRSSGSPPTWVKAEPQV